MDDWIYGSIVIENKIHGLLIFSRNTHLYRTREKYADCNTAAGIAKNCARELNKDPTKSIIRDWLAI